jgi:hypothetical protein
MAPLSPSHTAGHHVFFRFVRLRGSNKAIERKPAQLVLRPK